jgi:protoporphyrinogen oxidase
MSERIAVIGGGVLGMTLALRLAQQGRQVTLFEAADHFGGLADAWQLDDVVWDRHYHVTLLSDLRVRGILQELGLEQDMRWVETKTGFFSDGKLFSVSNTIEFLNFPALKFFDKIRLGLTISYASKINNWRKLEKLTAATWLERLSGKRAFQKIWLPLLRSKLGDNYAKASASFIWAIIARMYAARRTGLKKEMFGYLPGGYARLLDRFTTYLQQQGVTLKPNHRVERVFAENGIVNITFNNGHTEKFDQVVLTMAAGIAAQACPQLNSRERSLFKDVEYQGIICASLLMKQPLSPFYVTNITDTWVPFTGVIEMTALVDKSQFGGRSLVYLPKYVPVNDPMFEESDESIRDRFLAALVQMYPQFDRRDVLTFQVSRVRQVFAITTLNYSQKMPPMHPAIPGVHMVNSAHIANGTLNVNESIQLAETAAAELPQVQPRAQAAMTV